MEDNFFALGGHSLLATQVIGRLRRRYRIELPLKTLFDRPTVAALAPVVAAAQSQPQTALPALTPQPRSITLPLSFAQQRLWFLELLHPGGRGGYQTRPYHLPFALRLRGDLNAGALEQGFAALIARHEVLRTGFGSQDGVPYQFIQPTPPFRLARTDLSIHTEPERRARLQEIFDDLHGRPFDLARPPLLRAHLVQWADREQVLAVCLHHIVADGWSIGLLVQELAEGYAAYSRGDSPDWPPLAVQYADFALWQRRHLPGAVWRRQLEYWRQQLAGAEPLLLLPGAGAPAHPRGTGGRHLQTLPPALADALRALALAHDATLFMVLHAALAVLLHQQTGRTDLLIGADVANRHRQETEGMAGFFVNPLVLRCRLAREQRFSQVLAACRDTALAAWQHQDLPFDALVAELLPQRDGRHSPFFQT
ncbi:MAG: condensation domain-containing protein, partial [Pseudomonadota bacterium]|nr:condensation domain-containing protein [Pseudomonadota bacterium]